jgi:hypothetical protein
MPRNPQWAQWPFAFGWIWWPSGEQGRPGHVRVGHLDSDKWWELPIRTWDELAQRHMNDRTIKPGQPVQMADRRVLEVPYQMLDDEADALLRRQMRPNMDRSPVKIKMRDGTVIEAAPRDWFEGLAASHVQRRKQEPAISMRLGEANIVIDYECFDAIVKDFVRNQRDRFVAAGKWPELLIHEGVAKNPKDQGPLPVQGRSDAFGHGAVPGLNAPKPIPGQGQVSHPAIENQELV